MSTVALLPIMMICVMPITTGATSQQSVTTADDRSSATGHDAIAADAIPKDVVARTRNAPARVRPRALTKIPLPSPKPRPINRNHATPRTAASADSGMTVNGKPRPSKQTRIVQVQILQIQRPAGLSPGTLSHRGPNPAVIGGSVNTAARNVGRLNGTQMSRRPNR